MIVVDTSAIVAFMDASDAHHESVSTWLNEVEEDLVTTPLVLAETDHLIGARGGPAALAGLRADLAAGAYLIDWWDGAIGATLRVADRYADSGLGLPDASLVALAQRVGTVRIGTLDERHFRVVRPLDGEPAFELLPRDL